MSACAHAFVRNRIAAHVFLLGDLAMECNLYVTTYETTIFHKMYSLTLHMYSVYHNIQKFIFTWHTTAQCFTQSTQI